MVWRDSIPLHLEEAEIEYASKIKIDWLTNAKELGIIEGHNKSAIMDNISITSFAD